MRRAPRSSSARAVSARNGCASRKRVCGPTAGSASARRGGRNATGAMPQFGEQAPPLVLDDVGERADDEQRCRRVGRRGGQLGHQRREARVLALRERRLDAAARIVEHAHARRERARKPRGGARQVELDHFRRARADEEQQLDVGPALEQARDDAVEFVVGVGEAGEIALVDDRGGEARLGEDHHAGRRLDEVRAGARADDEEERVLDLAMQPDDAGQPAEHLALAALAQHRRVGAAVARRGVARA